MLLIQVLDYTFAVDADNIQAELYQHRKIG
jgi:hypothetical protein